MEVIQRLYGFSRGKITFALNLNTFIIVKNFRKSIIFCPIFNFGIEQV